MALPLASVRGSIIGAVVLSVVLAAGTGRDLAEVLSGGEAATGQALPETDPWLALAGICGS